MKSLLVFACLLAVAGADASALDSITVDRTRATATVRASGVSLDDLVRAAKLRSGTSVSGTIPEMDVTMTIRDVPLDRLVETILTRAGLIVERQNGTLRLRDPGEKTVSLDVVNVSVAEIVESLADQCGVRNVMIDPDV